MASARLIIGILCAPLFAGSLTVTVKDSAGAPLGDAFVAVTGSAETALHTGSSAADGTATVDKLPAGNYAVSITRLGFDPWQGRITASDDSTNLSAQLKLSSPMTSVKVSQRRSPLANSNSDYETLRNGKLRRVYTVSNLVITRDAGTFTFRSGSFSFLPAVEGRVTTGVFVGDGNFRMKPRKATRLKCVLNE